MPGPVPSVRSLLFSITEIDSHRLLHFFQTCMAYILALNKKNDIFADVLGVISHSLEGPGTPGDAKGVPDFTRIFHHARDQLAGDGIELLVDKFIIRDRSERSLGIQTGKGIQRIS